MSQAESVLPEFNLEWDPQNFSILELTFTIDLNKERTGTPINI